MKAKVTYRGWPGHFCCVHVCGFRLNTLIECGKTKIVVSTVGWRRGKTGKIEEIEFGRYYETRAFHAKRQGEFWDADVTREIQFNSPWSWGKKDELKAQKGHERVVAEIVRRLEAGETLK